METNSLFKGVSGFNDITIPGRRKIGQEIDRKFSIWKNELSQTIKCTEFLCQTADIWSTKTKSFIGVTVHWLDANLKRQSQLLACRRFAGRHTFDRIASILFDINKEFGLRTSQIVATVTDNASNFVKAFKEFSVELILPSLSDDDEDDSESEDSGYEQSMLNFITIGTEEEESHTDLEPLSDNYYDEVFDFDNETLQLSEHQRCAVHTLNLIPTSDLKKILKANSTLRIINTVAMTKLSKLWNAGGRPQSAEIIASIFGCGLVRPSATRWNSLFDSVDQLLKKIDVLDDVFNALKLPKLNNREKNFIVEYHTIFKPIALAIDHLQSQNECYFACLVPSLFALKKKLDSIDEFELEHCKPLLAGIKTSLLRRFQKHFEIDISSNARSAFLASLSHPFYKMRFMNGIQNVEGKIELLRLTFLLEMRRCNDLENTTPVHPAFQEIDEKLQRMEQFYGFEEVAPTRTGDIYADEFKLYLNDTSSMDPTICLQKYPIIKKVFHHYNTIIPSSAPVERVFSFAKMILRPQRRNIKDDLFEKLLVLKVND